MTSVSSDTRYDTFREMRAGKWKCELGRMDTGRSTRGWWYALGEQVRLRCDDAGEVWGWREVATGPESLDHGSMRISSGGGQPYRQEGSV